MQKMPPFRSGLWNIAIGMIFLSNYLGSWKQITIVRWIALVGGILLIILGAYQVFTTPTNDRKIEPDKTVGYVGIFSGGIFFIWGVTLLAITPDFWSGLLSIGSGVIILYTAFKMLKTKLF